MSDDLTPEIDVNADAKLERDDVTQTAALDDERDSKTAALDDERPTSRSDAKDPWHGLNDFDEE